MGHLQGFEFLDGMCTAGGRRDVMVARQQQREDARMGKAHDAFSPFALIGRRRRAVLIGITGEDHQINLLLDGSIHNIIQ